MMKAHLIIKSSLFYLKVLGEVQECVKTGLWVGDCFIYTNGVNRLNYYVGGEIVTISHLDRYNFVVNLNIDIITVRNYPSIYMKSYIVILIF